MQQYWTPLARVLGLYGDTEAAPSQGTAPPPPPPQDQHLATHWPQLFEAFRRHALEEWVPACERHAEVSPKDMMGLKALAITPHDAVIAQQLSHWQREGSTQDLVRWLVQGPWNVPPVLHWIDFSGFDSLTVRAAPQAPAPAEPASRFDWRQQPQAAPGGKARVWEIEAQTEWVERPQAPAPSVPEPPMPEPTVPESPARDTAPVSGWQIKVSDARPARAMPLPLGLAIVGQEKTVRLPDGTTQALKDGTSLAWEGQDAKYHAVQGALVSGLHLALRTGADGVQCQDLGSTNGTYLGERRLAAGTWTDCPAGVLLYLGGPAGDLRSQAPSLEIARAQPARPVAVEATPLRPVEDVALLRIEPATGGAAVIVRRLPFMIGRDPRCDWVIGAEHAMVSRQHLVIEEIDPAGRRIRVRDLSSQGLTQCGSLSAQALKAGEWIAQDATLVLGASAPYPGVAFALRRNA